MLLVASSLETLCIWVRVVSINFRCLKKNMILTNLNMIIGEKYDSNSAPPLVRVICPIIRPLFGAFLVKWQIFSKICFFFGVRVSNPEPCIYYALSLLTELSSWGLPKYVLYNALKRY